jgi:hypothetical protein
VMLHTSVTLHSVRPITSGGTELPELLRRAKRKEPDDSAARGGGEVLVPRFAGPSSPCSNRATVEVVL